MKKLLILCLVLALCSAASAALNYHLKVTPEVGDPYDWDGGSVKPSDIITVSIIEDGPTNLGFAGLSISGQGDYQADSLKWQAGMGGLNVDPMQGSYIISGQVLYFPGTQPIN
ncbi:MAG: hypothetical protein ACYTBP_10095, partial [Planctomycetota bacterium]